MLETTNHSSLVYNTKTAATMVTPATNPFKCHIPIPNHSKTTNLAKTEDHHHCSPVHLILPNNKMSKHILDLISIYHLALMTQL